MPLEVSNGPSSDPEPVVKSYAVRSFGMDSPQSDDAIQVEQLIAANAIRLDSDRIYLCNSLVQVSLMQAGEIRRHLHEQMWLRRGEEGEWITPSSKKMITLMNKLNSETKTFACTLFLKVL